MLIIFNNKPLSCNSYTKNGNCISRHPSVSGNNGVHPGNCIITTIIGSLGQILAVTITAKIENKTIRENNYLRECL